MKKDLAYYRALPYQRVVEVLEDEDDGKRYFQVSYVEIPEIEGIDEGRLAAIKLANELFDDFIEANLEWGNPIPEPEAKRFRAPGGQQKLAMPEVGRSLAGQQGDLRARATGVELLSPELLRV